MTYDDFEFQSCGECGIMFAAPKVFFNERRKGDEGSRRNWYCPNGHARVFRETDADKMRREVDRLKQQMARVEEERETASRREAAAKRETARILKRVGAGVCPCCKRTVHQLANHMQTMHPDVPFVTPIRKPTKSRVNSA